MAILGTTYYVDTELAMLVRIAKDKGDAKGKGMPTVKCGAAKDLTLKLALKGEGLPDVQRGSQMLQSQ